MIFQKFSQNKKRKGEKPMPPHSQTAQRGYMNVFLSLRRLDGQFCCSRRKSRFGPKLREEKKRLFPNIFSWELHHILGLCVSLVTDCHTAPVQLPACHHGLHFKILPHHPNKTLEDRRRQNIGWKERRKNLDARMKYHTRPCYSFLQREI